MLERFTQPGRVQLRTQSRILVYDRLSLYLSSGISMLRAFEFLYAESKPSERSFYIEVKTDIAEGKPLSFALLRSKPRFSTLETHFIATGEESGNLPETLRRLASLLRKEREFRQKIRSALAYPLLIGCVSVLVVVFLVTYAFPKLIPLFEGLHVSLPWTTRLLITIVAFCSHYWIAIILAVLAIAALSVYFSRHQRVRDTWEFLTLRIPISRELVQAYYVAVISRALASMLASGVPLVRALDITSKSMPRSDYRISLRSAEATTRQGEKLSSGLSAYPQLYMPLAVQMIAAGEVTGSLVSCLQMCGEQCERNLDEKLQVVTRLCEPLLMIGIGVIVGFVALAIVSPLYGITQNLRTY
jgi:type II secretory pathway component PulF